MIWNIIDRRTRPYRWGRINAIIEAVEHDNSVADADQAPESGPLDVIDYDQREGVTVKEAVDWAHHEVQRANSDATRRVAQAAEDFADEANYQYRRLRRHVNRHPVATAAIVAGTIGAFLLLRRAFRGDDED